MSTSIRFVGYALLAVGASAGSMPTYTSVKVVTDTTSIVVNDFNDAAQAITARWTDAGARNPVIQHWANGGVPGSAAISIGTMRGTARMDLRALNDNQQVVGAGRNAAPEGSVPPDDLTRAYLYSNGEFTDLSRLIGGRGAEHSLASGINNRGQVIGLWSDEVGGGRHAFLYTRGKVSEISAPGGALSVQNLAGINELGQIVGTFTQPGVPPEPSTSQTFIHDRGVSAKIDVGYPNFAVDINERGEIAGYAVTGTRDTRCYLFSRGVVSFIGAPPRDNLLVNCTVLGISDAGAVAGDMSGPAVADRYPFVYSNGTLNDLNALIAPGDPLAVDRIKLRKVIAINGRGQIVASAGSDDYYLLTPVDEVPPPPPPTTSSLLGGN
jgi:probable HAF family extracellular repeat protein